MSSSELAGKKTDYVADVLHEGGKNARQRIAATVATVKNKMGVPFY